MSATTTTTLPLAAGTRVAFFPNCGGRIDGTIVAADAFAYTIRADFDGHEHRRGPHGVHVIGA